MAGTIRKPVDKLTADDLRRHPVWVYALDEEDIEGQDETTVRPFRQRQPLDVLRGLYIVRADFRLRSGVRFVGAVYSAPKGERSVADVQPVILTPGGPLLIWHGMSRPKKSELATALRSLGATSFSDAFPIHYRSDARVRFDGAPISGSVKGLYYLKGEETRCFQG